MAAQTKNIAQSFTYLLIILLGLGLIAGSFLLRFNFGTETAVDQQVIKYSYANVSKDPAKRNKHRQIHVTFENLNSLFWVKLGSRDRKIWERQKCSKISKLLEKR